LLASGLLERIGEGASLIRHRAENLEGELVEARQEIDAPDHRAAFNVMPQFYTVPSALKQGMGRMRSVTGWSMAARPFRHRSRSI